MCCYSWMEDGWWTDMRWDLHTFSLWNFSFLLIIDCWLSCWHNSVQSFLSTFLHELTLVIRTCGLSSVISKVTKNLDYLPSSADACFQDWSVRRAFGGCFFLAGEDFGGRFDDHFPACVFIFFFKSRSACAHQFHFFFCQDSPQWLSELRQLRPSVSLHVANGLPVPTSLVQGCMRV